MIALPAGSREADSALWRGVLDREGVPQRVVPEAISGGADGAEIRFRAVDPRESARPASSQVWVQAVRAFSLTATVMPCLAVALYGRDRGWALRPALALLAAAGAVVLQLSVNLWNDAEDHARLIDLPGGLGGSGVLQRGWLSAQQVKRAAQALLVLGLLLGLPAARAEPRLWGVGLLALVGVAGYSGRPIGLKYRALGDLAVVLLCGPVLTGGFALAAFGTTDSGVVGIGLLLGLCAVGLLHVNNLQDAEVDRARGAVTVAVLLGPRGSKLYLVAVYGVAFLAWAAVWPGASLRVWALAVPLVAAIPVARFTAELIRVPGAPAMKLARIRAGQLHLVTGAALCLGLALGRPSP